MGRGSKSKWNAAKMLVDPVGNLRVAKRLAAFVGLTATHLSRVPSDVSQVEMNARANAWGKRLVKEMGMEMTVDGEAVGNPGALLVANHRSYIDIIALLAATPCCFLAKGDVADWPVLGVAARRAGTVFVDRDAKDSRRAARDTVRALLEEGHTVVVFPEGTTQKGPGCGDWRIGAFIAAEEAGAPILPVAIEYPDPSDAWQDESFGTHFAARFRQPKVRVHLHFGPAMHGFTPECAVELSRQWVVERLEMLWDDFQNAHT